MFEDYILVEHTGDYKRIREVLARYGYGIETRQKDYYGNRAIKTFPIRSGGSTLYHPTISSFRKWMKNVILNRAMEEDEIIANKIIKWKHMLLISHNIEHRY